LESKYRF